MADHDADAKNGHKTVQVTRVSVADLDAIRDALEAQGLPSSDVGACRWAIAQQARMIREARDAGE